MQWQKKRWQQQGQKIEDHMFERGSSIKKEKDAKALPIAWGNKAFVRNLFKELTQTTTVGNL